MSKAKDVQIANALLAFFLYRFTANVRRRRKLPNVFISRGHALVPFWHVRLTSLQSH